MLKTIVSAIALFIISGVSAQFLEGKKNLQKFDGYFNFYYSEENDEIYLEVDKLDTEFLYVHSLRTGLGSNDIGLDRGQLGGGELVKFIRSGNKLLLMQPNLDYRATSDNELERKSISEAFARSVLFGFPIKEIRGNTFIIDFTPFLMQDTHGVAARLKAGKNGTYKLDKTRSALWMERTKSFPKNSEFEALLTFTGTPAGNKVRSVAPNAESISVIQHHGFVELPDSGYKPRKFDPRCGSYPTTYMDYSTPVWEPIKKRFITRHRLEKKDPTAAVSEAKEPIIYYLDPGTPEPVRSALLDGARWWDEAFEAIGYRNAFQVKMLPEDADPLDVRYNVIQWVHRSTRGWSYGSTITDPRTGEIIKGHVSLGSLRIRQDFMIAQALMSEPFSDTDSIREPMLETALMRIRQLSAHEVGHTIGFAHNFAASTNNRASVMDYPHPSIKLTDGAIDFSNVYDTGIGEWDMVTVAYSYGDPPGNTSEEIYLNSILEAAFAKGLRYITDSDARAQGGAHAKAHLWDNGTDASAELENVLRVRKFAVEKFSEDNIRTGEPYSVLEDVFVPLYLYHRFQTEAAVKLIGGMEYDYLVKGYNGKGPSFLPKETQLRALNAVLETLNSEHLIIPKDKLALFPPRAYGYTRTRESFKSNLGVAFDPLGVAGTAAEMTLKLLLHPERANRLVYQKSLDKDNIGFQEVLDRMPLIKVYKTPVTAYEAAVDREISWVTLQNLLALLNNKKTNPMVKLMVNTRLDEILKLEQKAGGPGFLSREILAFRKDPSEYKIIEAAKIPDGSPIGMDCIIFTE